MKLEAPASVPFPGKIELKRERIDLGGAVRSTVEQARPALEADFVRLAQVVANLLNNAAKYTSSGGRVELAVRRESAEARISVRDTGIGIPQELLPRVFDMFAQAGERRSHAEGGLGIGLALARRLVELHGGRVEARSEGPGRGSEFVVHLPLTAPT